MADILPFDPKPYPDARSLCNPSGTYRIDARTYLPFTHHDLESGKLYSLHRLRSKYGLPENLPPMEDGTECPGVLFFRAEPIG